MENTQMNSETKNVLNLLSYLWKCPEEAEKNLKELKDTLFRIPNVHNLQEIQHYIILTINNILNRLNKSSSHERKLKCLITDIIKTLCDKTRIDNINAFFTISRFLIEEVYDQEKALVRNINEEYKLIIVQAIISLIRALTWNVIQQLYTREYILRLSPMFYVVMLLAKHEQLRSLRMASIECLMSLVKVDDNSDASDIEIRYQVSDVFIFYLPGILQGLSEIALEDEIHGHNVALLAVRAWGRMVALGLQNYNPIDSSPIIENDTVLLNSESVTSLPRTKWKDKAKIDAYLQNTQRNLAWYKETDGKLSTIMSSLKKLTHHSRSPVRLELMHCCLHLIELCSTTIPITISKTIEVLIILSEDENDEISHTSGTVVAMMSEKFSSEVCKSLLENLEENFYDSINALPRVCNSLDESEQLSAINLLVGYLKLFGNTHLSQVLHSVNHLKRLMQTLVQFCELERDVTLYEEYRIQDLEMAVDHHTPWKNFRYCRSAAVQTKIEVACGLLAKCDVLDMATDVLLEYFMEDEENRNEITVVLNNVLVGLTASSNVINNLPTVNNIVSTYLDPEYWNLPLEVSYNCMLPQVKNNVIQICLQLEGLSKIAIAIQGEFKPFLFKALYAILEHAGSGNQLIKTAGIAAIANVSVACGYGNVTELINNNIDYFSYHVIRKIQHAEHNESVLNVLTVVIKYGDMNILQSISDIIGGVLIQTCDKFFQERNANAYLRVFEMFIKSIMKWFNIDVKIEPIKSKLQQKMEHDDFEISNLSLTDQPDTDLGKTAEEMYKEDLENRKQQEQELEDFEPQCEECKKLELPNEIQLTTWLLERCLNFLPSKNRTRKLLVLEILKNGLEIVRDWEDTLLPLVHKIWSPLIDRFKEKDDSVIINHSFQLLVTLARLSKDFIRSRTAKDVLPQIKKILIDLSKLSYLKDAGAAYRYTQAYKLQITIVQQLGRVITDLDLADCYINEAMEAVILYLDDKQPLPLQEAAVGFFCDIARFDKELVLLMFQKSFPEDGVQNDKLAYNKNKQAVLQKIYELS
ncbi:hypothetical protein ILUMI_02227 [Ignelater luminosus]|uniref:TELO2-interacting protein 1 homolog n=1 Tax=Ignelater luminosus TaxID=2038154 RepID=A0A8K0GND9_IGNLU|nr:hypothetical protein ILUMI_02227 [Ignelater luminosus]